MQPNSASNSASPRMFAESERQYSSPAGSARDQQANGRRGIDRSANTAMPSGKPGLDLSASKDFKLHELTMLSIAPIFRSIHHWWLHRAEQHYLICADVEQQRAREAQMNVAYYQKRAALARSARN